jgi:hypothetical protein
MDAPSCSPAVAAQAMADRRILTTRLPHVTTAESLLTPQGAWPAGPGGAWPVLARIPDVAATARPAPQRPPRPAASASAHTADYRFDPPQPRRSEIAAAMAAPPNDRTESGEHAAHTRRPPAHHLHQRMDRTTLPQPDRVGSVDSPALPKWDPFTIPANRFPDLFAPVLSFLLLVALFTAAGTSILMLRNSDRQPVSVPPNPSQPGIQQSADGPTALGPRGLPAARLELEVDSTVKNQPTASSASPTTLQSPSSPSTSSTPFADDDAANSEVTNFDVAPPVPATPEPPAYPRPAFPETSELPTPQAQMSDPPPAIARLPRIILPVPPSQAQHVDQPGVY